jgi:hypothetical protein
VEAHAGARRRGRGAHTWVMTGYRATGDMVTNPNAVFTGAYVVDPWYPRVSSIRGQPGLAVPKRRG